MYGRGHQQPSMRIGPPMTPPVIKNLMIANAVVFVAQFILGAQGGDILTGYGSVIPMAFWEHGYLWQPFTYMWLHGSFGHIAMNMFSLWMFGSQLVFAWGPQRFFRFYLICGIGAGLIIATYPYFFISMDPTRIIIPTLGASGAVYGVLLAYSLTWPERTITLIFPPVSFRAIWLIPGLFLMTAIMGGGRNISHIGHLGGVIVAWFYMRRHGQAGTLLSMSQLRYRWKRYRMRQKLRSVRYDEFEAKRREQDKRKFH